MDPIYGGGTYAQYVALEQACKDIKYKPGWYFEPFSSDLGCGVHIFIRNTPDAYEPGYITDVHQTSVIDPYWLFGLDEDTFDDVRFKAWIKSKIVELEHHEIDEFLMWKGERLVEHHPKKPIPVG